MAVDFPIKFTLDDGVSVEINKTANKTYDFTLTPEEGVPRHFTYVDDKPRNEITESLDFDQLNAVRRFWLEQEDMDLD